MQKAEEEPLVGIVGLGYVGLPLARLMAQRYRTVGFDINPQRVERLRSGKDWTGELSDGEVEALIGNPHFSLSVNIEDLSACNVYIVAVPTPVDVDNRADLQPLRRASVLVGTVLAPGDLVVYESTVYPGVTEEECVPCLVRSSGLRYNEDFFVGYSPERINPGDRLHTVETIRKVTSGSTPETARRVDSLYRSVLKGGTFPVSSIRVAEAAKLLENSQRDVNIAFMNEMALGLHRMGINTADVIEAMNTKWNALKFYPGLVGGHCIGVDPYYFVYETEKLGFHSSIITTARRINDDLPATVAHEIVREIIRSGENPSKMKIYMLGATFKGNCPDLRNTKAKDVKKELEDYGLTVYISDLVADPEELEREFQQKPVKIEDIKDADCLIFTADHKAYKDLTPSQISDMMKDSGCRLIADVRNIFKKRDLEEQGCRYWNL